VARSRDPEVGVLGRRTLLVALLAIAALRVATLGAIPLLDKSEARYAEIGRQMVVTSDWVMPQLEPGQPYWGKPPLHFWATALSLRALGFSEFAARLPSLLGALLVLFAAERMARRLRGPEAGWLTCLILASSALFFALSAQVALDLTLTACSSAALAGFFLGHGEADPKRARLLHWLGFLALGAGLLAKGPVAIALWAGTLALACVLTRDLRWLRGVPWLSGGLIAAAVSLPWFLAAERGHPGFLRYFFIQENLLRFVASDYGDRYGHGHTLPYGTIWAFALLALMPWSPALLVLFWRGLRTGGLARLRLDPERSFLWAWSLAPLIFFTASRNLVVTYALPALPAIAVLLADALLPREGSRTEAEPETRQCPGLAAALLVGGALVLLAVVAGVAGFTRWVSVPGPTLALLGGLIASCAGLLAAAARDRRRQSLILATALCIPLLDATGRTLLAGEIGSFGSTRELVQVAAAGQRERHCELQFFREVPYSARFYGAPALSLDGDAARLHPLVDAGECRLLAVEHRGRHAGKDAPGGLHPVRDFGGWILYGNAAAG
jgi:4-amino-4-deoxy-L-arabinose transferase-like glycosyltransferase